MKELPTMQELQSFITYNKTGSFTLAAQSMNITQSAFSAQMKKLERLVGVKLISRSTRGTYAKIVSTLLYSIYQITKICPHTNLQLLERTNSYTMRQI